MFWYIKTAQSNTEVIRWTIELGASELPIVAKSILNLQSEEYQSFLDGLFKMIEAKGYTHEDEYDHKSNSRRSKSRYFTFLKYLPDKTVQVVVEVRISDHGAKFINGIPPIVRRKTYRKYNVVPQIMRDTNTTDVPQDYPLNIVFNDKNFTDYISALTYANKQVNRLP